MKKQRHAHLHCEHLEARLALSGLNVAGVEFRTITGTNNHQTLVNQGAAETQQIRFGYGDRFIDDEGDEIITTTSTPSRSNPRTTSNVLFSQSGNVLSERHLTDWSFQWGQWLTHDMDLTRNGAQFNVLSDGVTVGDFRIPIEDPNDPLGPNPIPFNRSQYFPGTGVNGVRRDVVNAVTSYIDASNVYGSDPTRAAALRTFSGGKLKTSAGNLLPLNTAGLPNEDAFGAGAALFLAGDVRANEQIGLTVVHTLFVREHNRLATRIHNLYPGLNDEQIFQVARRLVGAEQQVITYREYLPAVLGYDFAPDAAAFNYDPLVDASVTNSFAHAAFRFGHSEINENTLLVNNQGQTLGTLSIRDAFFNPDILKDNPGNVGRILKGLASQTGQDVDLLLVDGIRNNLFGPPGAGGLDLGALDIQRGRDHGLPDYNNLRGNYGLTPVDSFDDITSDVAVQQKLQMLFGTVDNIDAFVGMLAEDHLPGSSVGPLLHGIIGNQFLRLRDGDRFFYTDDAFLQSAEVKAILDVNTVRLSDVIMFNTNISNIQENVFFDNSVLFFESPASGANISVVAAAGVVTIVNNDTLQVIVTRAMSNVSQVILVGSSTNADVFNLFIAQANGGLEDGVLAYGRSGPNDRLNVFGRPVLADTFVVSGQTVSANTTTPQSPDVVLPRSVQQVSITVNAVNRITSSGFETTRIVTLGIGDTVIDPALLALVVTLWDPFSDN